MDSAGDVFIIDFRAGIGGVAELPRTTTGYGPQTTLPASGLSVPTGFASDSAGDVFIADFYNNRVVELPFTETGYGPQTTLVNPFNYYPYGVAVDSSGDVFITYAIPAPPPLWLNCRRQLQATGRKRPFRPAAWTLL